MPISPVLPRHDCKCCPFAEWMAQFCFGSMTRFERAEMIDTGRCLAGDSERRRIDAQVHSCWLYRRSDLNREWFRRSFQRRHERLAAAIPGVRRYIQNFIEPEEQRDPPWDIAVEFWFDNREAMERAWQSRKGRLSIEDNSNCLDLAATATSRD
jgi:uncharacterized protein (TIGR02118 family)